MSLSCGCDWDDAPSVFRQRSQKARKEHECCECGEIISPGQDYEYTFGVWDGEQSSYHTCEKCADLRDSLTAAGFCVGFGDLKADYAEYLEEYDPPKLSA